MTKLYSDKRGLARCPSAYEADMTKILTALGVIDTWRVSVTEVDSPHSPGNKYDGTCACDFRYYTAEIEIRRDLNEDVDLPTLRRTFIHEALHIPFAEMDNTVEVRTAELLKDKLKSHAVEMYNDALERLVTHLAYVFYPLIFEQGDQVEEDKQEPDDQFEQDIHFIADHLKKLTAQRGDMNAL